MAVPWRLFEKEQWTLFEANRASPKDVIRFCGLQGAEVAQGRGMADTQNSWNDVDGLRAFISSIWLVVHAADRSKHIRFRNDGKWAGKYI